MARRKGKKKGRSRTKTVSIGQTLGWGAYAYKVGSETARDPNPLDRFITSATGLRFGAYNPDGTGFRKPEWAVMKETWQMPVAGMLVSKIMPKIPFIGRLPKSIPFIGKKLRW